MKPMTSQVRGLVVLFGVLLGSAGLVLPGAARGEPPQNPPVPTSPAMEKVEDVASIRPLGSANMKRKTIRAGQMGVLTQPVRRNRELPATDEPGGPPQLVLETQGFTGAVVGGLAFSPDGRLLAAAGDVVRIWDVATGELKHTLRGQTEMGGVGACTNLAFAPDGKH